MGNLEKVKKNKSMTIGFISNNHPSEIREYLAKLIDSGEGTVSSNVWDLGENRFLTVYSEGQFTFSSDVKGDKPLFESYLRKDKQKYDSLYPDNIFKLGIELSTQLSKIRHRKSAKKDIEFLTKLSEGMNEGEYEQLRSEGYHLECDSSAGRVIFDFKGSDNTRQLRLKQNGSVVPFTVDEVRADVKSSINSLNITETAKKLMYTAVEKSKLYAPSSLQSDNFFWVSSTNMYANLGNDFRFSISNGGTSLDVINRTLYEAKDLKSINATALTYADPGKIDFKFREDFDKIQTFKQNFLSQEDKTFMEDKNAYIWVSDEGISIGSTDPKSHESTRKSFIKFADMEVTSPKPPVEGPAVTKPQTPEAVSLKKETVSKPKTSAIDKLQDSFKEDKAKGNFLDVYTKGTDAELKQHLLSFSKEDIDDFRALGAHEDGNSGLYRIIANTAEALQNDKNSNYAKSEGDYKNWTTDQLLLSLGHTKVVEGKGNKGGSNLTLLRELKNNADTTGFSKKANGSVWKGKQLVATAQDAKRLTDKLTKGSPFKAKWESIGAAK